MNSKEVLSLSKVIVSLPKLSGTDKEYLMKVLLKHSEQELKEVYNIQIKFELIDKKSNGVIYCQLWKTTSDDKDELLISGDLSYILKETKRNNQKIENLQEQLEILMNQNPQYSGLKYLHTQSWVK